MAPPDAGLDRIRIHLVITIQMAEATWALLISSIGRQVGEWASGRVGEWAKATATATARPITYSVPVAGWI